MKLPEKEIARLRECFSQFTSSNPTRKRILMVGAKLMKSRSELGYADFYELSQSLQTLQYANLSADENYEVEIMNLDQKHGGEDFLKTQTETDILILCYLYNGSDYSHCEGDYKRISKLHSEEKWKEAAEATKAKVVIVSYMSREIRPEHLEGNVFEHVLTRKKGEIFYYGLLTSKSALPQRDYH